MKVFIYLIFLIIVNSILTAQILWQNVIPKKLPGGDVVATFVECADSANCVVVARVGSTMHISEVLMQANLGIKYMTNILL